MTVTLELRPNVEASLAAQARTKGVSLNTYLQDAIEDLAGSERTEAISLPDLEAALDTLAEMGKDLAPLPSSTFSRDVIYQDHD